MNHLIPILATALLAVGPATADDVLGRGTAGHGGDPMWGTEALAASAPAPVPSPPPVAEVWGSSFLEWVTGVPAAGSGDDASEAAREPPVTMVRRPVVIEYRQRGFDHDPVNPAFIGAVAGALLAVETQMLSSAAEMLGGNFDDAAFGPANWNAAGGGWLGYMMANELIADDGSFHGFPSLPPLVRSDSPEAEVPVVRVVYLNGGGPGRGLKPKREFAY